MKRRSSSPARRRISVWRILLIALLVALLIGFLIERYQINQGLSQTEEQAGQPGQNIQPLGPDALQVFFTTPTLIYPDVASRRTPPPYEQSLIADIDAARAMVELATFEYNLTSVAEALVRAEKRGVNVRLVLDREILEKPEMANWAGMVEKAKIPISWEESSAFMHSKFVIIDRRVVWTGSWNVTVNDTYRNNNNLLRITIPAIVGNYSAEFEQMFAGRFDSSRKRSITPSPQIDVNGVRIETYFSPQDGALDHVLERLRGAKQSIDFMAFSFTSDATAEVMLDRHAAGVVVRGVFERRNLEGSGGEFAKLKRAGADVLEDGNCYTMHHKVIVIDGRTVITGSYNFTNRAENVNDENLLIIDDPTLARQFLEEFDRVYRQAGQPTRCNR